MRIGIVSDTHDRLPEALFEALAGVDEILHAGDVTDPDTLATIESIAPVLAVRGNCDRRDLFDRLPEERLITREGVRIAIVHGHRQRRGSIEDMVERYGSLAPDLVVFGHSHEAVSRAHDGTRYFNPGTAGGVGAPPTCGLLSIGGGDFTLDFIELGGETAYRWQAGQ